MNYDTILFDLDGTLTDPGVGITNAVRYALEKRGIIEADRSKLYRFIGPPLIESFERFYGWTHEEAVQGLADYREYFGPKGIFENEVLTGVPEMLAALLAEGRKLVLATSKPEFYARQILAHFDLLKFFEGVHGATMDETRSTKSEVIAWALAHTPNVGCAVMVGDRFHDIEGANANGIDSVGVLFGYGDEQELREADATYLVKTVEELQGLLIGAESH